MEIDIGIKEADRKKVADQLQALFADTYNLYYKTHAYHWNVTGPRFQPLHDIFETQYNELWLALDEIAERIRSLGFYAPAGYDAIASRTAIPADTEVPSADDMIGNLVKGHEAVSRTAKKVLDVAEKAGDTATDDLVSPRVSYHEKTAWMLRAMLETEASHSLPRGSGAAKKAPAKKSARR